MLFVLTLMLACPEPPSESAEVENAGTPMGGGAGQPKFNLVSYTPGLLGFVPIFGGISQHSDGTSFALVCSRIASQLVRMLHVELFEEL